MDSSGYESERGYLYELSGSNIEAHIRQPFRCAYALWRGNGGKSGDNVSDGCFGGIEGVEERAEGVYVIDLLGDDVCNDLCDELEAIEQWAEDEEVSHMVTPSLPLTPSPHSLTDLSRLACTHPSAQFIRQSHRHSPHQLTSSTHSSIHSLTHSSTHSLTHSSTHSLTHSSTHSLTHPLTG